MPVFKDAMKLFLANKPATLQELSVFRQVSRGDDWLKLKVEKSEGERRLN